MIAGPFWILGDLNLNNPGAVQTPSLPPPGTRMPGTPRFLTSVSFFGENVRKAHWHTMRTWNPEESIHGYSTLISARGQGWEGGVVQGGKLTSHNQFTQVSIPLPWFFVATRESFRYIEEGKFRSLFW